MNALKKCQLVHTKTKYSFFFHFPSFNFCVLLILQCITFIACVNNIFDTGAMTIEFTSNGNVPKYTYYLNSESKNKYKRQFDSNSVSNSDGIEVYSSSHS